MEPSEGKQFQFIHKYTNNYYIHTYNTTLHYIPHIQLLLYTNNFIYIQNIYLSLPASAFPGRFKNQIMFLNKLPPAPKTTRLFVENQSCVDTCIFNRNFGKFLEFGSKVQISISPMLFSVLVNNATKISLSHRNFFSTMTSQGSRICGWRHT